MNPPTAPAIPDPAVFEKLGAFYLGRPFDPQCGAMGEGVFLYDSRDLVTHAVCVGMTGSGKTGLCLSLLEEAAIDGVPAIIIDPKGDLGNLLLTFPELRPEDFRPWIDEGEAARKGLDADAYAAQQARLWAEGLASWGEGPERIRKLRESAEFAIYTPGGGGGSQVDVYSSFRAPGGGDPAASATRALTATASLLGLINSDADPASSREGILLSKLFTDAWEKGEDATVEGLIAKIQNPPFAKVGVLELETFYPSKDRFALVLALNNLLASPTFAAWGAGEPLDIARLLFTPAGKPRHAIFSIAHLDDASRMFFVSVLLNEFLAWTRAQSGTGSLRAILYMDEIFGYLPPTANPPSKLPLLTLLKQARAFGVGVVLATQNPVDLDYKALSNAGTWFIGRLQTERDKARVLDGLQGAAGGSFDRSRTEALLASLGNRVFLANNVHEDAPQTFQTRWTLSYLRGPLTRKQIEKLSPAPTAGSGAEHPAAQSAATAAPPPQMAPVAAATPPTLPPGIPQVFCASPGTANYRAVLLGETEVAYSSARLGINRTERVRATAEIPDAFRAPEWASGGSDHSPRAPQEGSFGEVPAPACDPKSYPKWESGFKSWIARALPLEIPACKALGLTAKPGESAAEFAARVRLAAREARDAETDRLRKKYAPKKAALDERLRRAQSALETQKAQAANAKMQTAISIGTSILGAFLGRKTSRAITGAGTAARGISRSIKEGGDVAGAEAAMAAIQNQIAALDAEFAAEARAISTAEPLIESLSIKAQAAGVAPPRVSLAWIPA